MSSTTHGSTPYYYVPEPSRHPAMAELGEHFHGAAAMALHGLQTWPFWLALGGVVTAYVFYIVNPSIPAAMHARLGWRGFAAVMVGSAVASLGALISPAVFAALEGGERRGLGREAVALEPEAGGGDLRHLVLGVRRCVSSNRAETWKDQPR